jgi:hypothetical protein
MGKKGLGWVERALVYAVSHNALNDYGRALYKDVISLRAAGKCNSQKK